MAPLASANGRRVAGAVTRSVEPTYTWRESITVVQTEAPTSSQNVETDRAAPKPRAATSSCPAFASAHGASATRWRSVTRKGHR